MGFTENQNKVIEHGKGTLLVKAGPGSGKTTAIIARKPMPAARSFFAVWNALPVRHVTRPAKTSKRNVAAVWTKRLTFAMDAQRKSITVQSLINIHTMQDFPIENIVKNSLIPEPESILPNMNFVKKTVSSHRSLSRDSRPIRSLPTIRNWIFLSGLFIPISIRDCSQQGMLIWNEKWNSNHASVIKLRSQTGLFLSIGRIRTSRLCSFHSLLKWILYTPQGIQRKRCLHFSSQGKSCFLLFWWTVVQKGPSASYLTA